MAQFPEIQALFESNKLWAEKVKETDPELFPTQSKGQVSGVWRVGDERATGGGQRAGNG
jgi:hypothetical protein